MSRPIFIFDFDGTIADTYHFMVGLYNRFAAEYGSRPVTPDEVERLKDKTIPELIKILDVPLFKIPAIVARAKREYTNNIHAVCPIDGIQAALRHLHRRGVLLGIVSSNARQNILDFLTRHDLDIFDCIHSTSSILAKHISLRKLVANNGWALDQVIYIGDEIRDIQAARRLSIRCASVTWGYNSTRSLEKHHPDFVVRTPADLQTLPDRLV